MRPFLFLLAFAAVTTLAADHGTPDTTDTRPVVDGGEKTPAVAIRDPEFIRTVVEPPINEYAEYQVASSGLSALSAVPEGAGPYRTNE